MKRPSSPAFTLIEMLVVMMIIVVIASLVIGVAGYTQKKGAMTQTQGEIEAISAAIANYKADNGSAPRDEGVTEADGDDASDQSPLDPRRHGNPALAAYRNASRFLYQQLSGDADRDGQGGDVQNGTPLPSYMAVPRKNLSMTSANLVDYWKDPFGNSYGYSTEGARQEDIYRKASRKAKATTSADPDSPERSGDDAQGYNPTFDLWSTAGETRNPTEDAAATMAIQNKWIKNW